MAEHRDRHDLDVVGLRGLHGGGDGLAVGERAGLAEQVEHAPADGGSERFRHGPRVPGPSRSGHLGAVEVGHRRLAADEPDEGHPGAAGRLHRRGRDGALTATTALKPAAHAFCTISKPARPLM